VCRAVTAVGATQGPESASPEIACQSNKGGVATSGGGFSTLNAQPSYQDAAVAAWRDTCNNETDCFPVETGNSFGQYVAYGGRAYPDLSLAGHNYQIVVGGQEYLVSGTAASTPAVAGLVSLVNAQRLAEGLSPVGLINPSIYASAAAFNDITVGKSECMGDLSGGSCCSSGFNATAGWDPVTGLGSVNFTAFKDIFPASRRRVRHLRNVAGSVSDGGNSSGRGSGSAGWTAAALLQSAWTGAVVAVSYVWNLL
jgi:tripeptidyl-peptidase I